MYVTVFKRFFDIVFSIVLLPVFILIYIVLSIIIKLEDSGPVFYNGSRLGEKGQVYQMHKFRSMKVDSPDLRNLDGSTFNSENDNRLLKIGKLIRKTSIDEIPQILNVLKGEMSIIGPRPDLPEMLDRYSDEEIFKLNVKPGITGYSQAYYRNSVKQEEKLAHDVYYSENLSLLFDIKIFFKSIETILLRKNVFKGEGN